MTVTPDGFDGVAADIGNSHELKCRRRQWSVRMLVEITHDVHFPFAAGARTVAKQFFQPHKTFAAVLPSDRQLLSDWLNIRRSHGEKLTRCGPARPQIHFE